MPSKYRRLLQQTEQENEEEPPQRQLRRRRQESTVPAEDEDDITLDDLQSEVVRVEEEEKEATKVRESRITESKKGKKKLIKGQVERNASASASDDDYDHDNDISSTAGLSSRFGKSRKTTSEHETLGVTSDDSSTLSKGRSNEVNQKLSERTLSESRKGGSTANDEDHHQHHSKISVDENDTDDEDDDDNDNNDNNDNKNNTNNEDEDEDDEDEGEDDVLPHAPRLYSCDACPHGIFTTHAALLAHAEERHAELAPDHARLHRLAARLCPVWSRARHARRAAIAMWGKKVLDIAVRRDAGPEKMHEAHRAREQLEIVVRRWHERARVFIFGSSVAMGVWDGMADIDFAVVDVDALDAGGWPPLERNAVRSITELLRRAGFSFVNLEPISHARVPIIKHHASSPILTTARRDAEDVVARSVRFVLNAPAGKEDRVMLEGSVRDAVGPSGVQQVWWNRTGDVMSMTLNSTTSAIRAAMCTPALVTPALRAKVQPVHDECRPELYNVDFDLSFRAFGIRNSNLLRQYLMSHPCARPGAIVLKDWSKTSGVNNSVNGYFTSYAINIMWIYYLIQKEYVPYVDPLDIPASLVNYTDFGPKYIPMVDPSLSPEELDALYRDAGDMLVGFFYFYSFEFDWEHHVISLNRPGITTKKMLGWHVEDVVPPMISTLGGGGGGSGGGGGGGGGANNGGGGGGSGSMNSGNSVGNGSNTKRHPTRYELCIEDPYEENLNLGRHIGITKSLRVRTELYRGMLSLLKDGEKESCVFASTDLAESADVAGTSPSALPARALFKLMALTTQAIAESKQLSEKTDSGNTMVGEKAGVTTVVAGGGGSSSSGSSNGIDSPSSSLQEGSSTFTSSYSPSSPISLSTGLIGVSEKKLESLFLEKAPTEYQLTRKVWNWHQLIHRLGYKIHRGYILPRREIGVRCLVRRDADDSLHDSNGNTNTTNTATNNNNNSNNNNNNNKRVATHGRNLTEGILRDVSRGFMTLTPEWVAWSTPWVSQHLRGYSRLTTIAGDTVTTGKTTSNNNSSTAPVSTLSSSGEPAVGLMRGTRRNASPVTAMMIMKKRMSMPVTMKVSMVRLYGGVKRFLPFKCIR
ncbi:RNA editing 3 terminal uridylyl transferase 1 [Trypanosoma theileri]|uniref:RNA uridylyltransferase n=1 Tax=Trypanosoma theileri TaxID=67003 RepID=A0A1X0NQ69_9TRYP|nr:RNA editing 3 terminal uridylyl transferase 1 [Trypanosoma theileri]ORC86280.1 RNA editing 3 terminal uridylyl transferase 1 [Trypanosoma theileri]